MLHGTRKEGLEFKWMSCILELLDQKGALTESICFLIGLGDFS